MKKLLVLSIVSLFSTGVFAGLNCNISGHSFQGGSAACNTQSNCEGATTAQQINPGEWKVKCHGGVSINTDTAGNLKHSLIQKRTAR
jgi:hypothetical protein